MNCVTELKDLLSEIPPNWDKIKRVLESYRFTKQELTEIALHIMDNCFNEYGDAKYSGAETISLESLHSAYLIHSLELLLECGLDPNDIADFHKPFLSDNVLWGAQWVDAPNVGAGALRLLLERGGNPNIDSDAESLFDYVAFRVAYDDYDYDYEFAHVAQCWLVLMAFGGRFRDGTIPLTMLNGHAPEIFRNFERFDYEIEPLPQEPDKYGCWRMRIYDKATKEEVARYG